MMAERLYEGGGVRRSISSKQHGRKAGALLKMPGGDIQGGENRSLSPKKGLASQEGLGVTKVGR